MSTTFLMRDANGNPTGDWVLESKTGRPRTVVDRAKLEQDIQENLSIATQPNGFGAGLDDLIGQDVDPFVFRLQVQRQVLSAINAMQQLQQQYLADQRPATEMIVAVTNLVVSQANLGLGLARTAYTFNLTVQPAQGVQVTTGGTLV